jgi:N-acetylneuraminic acid mutarotase
MPFNPLTCRKGASAATSLDGSIAYVWGGASRELGNLIEVNQDPRQLFYLEERDNANFRAIEQDSDAAAIAPPSRQRATLVTHHSLDDAKKTGLVLFGGSGFDEFERDVFYNDVWMWTEKQGWTRCKATGAGPTPRRAHSAVAYNGKHMVVFAGRDAKGVLADTWVLDLNSMSAWTQLAAKFTGSARKGHSACVVGNEMIVFGGRPEDDMAEYDGDLHVLDMHDDDLGAWTWRAVKPLPAGPRPAARNHHAAAVVGNKMLIMGGRSCHATLCAPLDDGVWAYDRAANSWERIEAKNSPPARIEAVSWANSKFYVGLGQTARGVVLNDVWALDLDHQEWSRVVKLDCPPSQLSRYDGVLAYLVGLMLGGGVLLVVAMWYCARMRRNGYEAIA